MQSAELQLESSGISADPHQFIPDLIHKHPTAFQHVNREMKKKKKTQEGKKRRQTRGRSTSALLRVQVTVHISVCISRTDPVHGLFSHFFDYSVIKLIKLITKMMKLKRLTPGRMFGSRGLALITYFVSG